ncbi:tautomerase family protein [Comamonas thiooxydans]|uniref:tautomerase family protein n=1 Tax=Comamonas thiooxydans TaxID=363952 RepID=UPI003D04BF81
MPLTHISIRAGKSEAFRQAVFDSLHQAMHETFDVPKDNQFMTISEHPASDFRYGANYLGIRRSDDLVMIQITANNTRTLEQKKQMFKRIAELLVLHAGVRSEDVFVNLVEVDKANWSLGHGVAQYA